MWGTDTTRTIVIVDDDPGCRELHRHWLETTYSIQTAASGEAALQIVDEDTEMVLLDREMPGLSGATVLDRLRTRGYDGYVIMVTGVRPDFDLVELALDDYLVKPISERELTAAIDRLWSRQDYHDQLRELFSLATKKARLEIEKDPIDLARSEEYRRLDSRLVKKRSALSERLLDTSADWHAAFEACDSTVKRTTSGT